MSFETLPLKISIITIVRNGIPFIEQTIKSVLSQTYNDIEYIVVDGASTDGTIDLLKRYMLAGAKLKFLSEPDRGISDAFNKGVSLAGGDYLLFLNSDDYLANDAVIQEVALQIIKNNSPTLIYGDCDIVDRESNRVLYRDIVKDFPRSILKGVILPHPSLFTSKRYFERYGLFDLSYQIAMDFEWMIRGGLKEKIVHVPLLVSAVRNGGLSGRVEKKIVAREILLALKKNGIVTSNFLELRVRGYFALRRFAKLILNSSGLYQMYISARNAKKSI